MSGTKEAEHGIIMHQITLSLVSKFFSNFSNDTSLNSQLARSLASLSAVLNLFTITSRLSKVTQSSRLW